MSDDDALTGRPARPYPGLRPFETGEWSIFLGRERMTDEVLRRLGERRIVVVHGRSGAGKSSLVRAGVIPRLTRLHRRAGLALRVVIMRPSGGPLWNLARAMADAVDRANDIEVVSDIRRRFDADGARLSALLAALDPDTRRPACLLIDQFEELLVQARGPGHDEAELFVELLAGAMERREGEADLRILVTMRSEFLGDCARFDGLAELVNESQYLLPRIGREELRRAIRRPAELYGGAVDSALVDRLLADTMGNADELPLIQHALMIMWDEARDQSPTAPTLSRQRYDQHPAGLAGILSDHADRLYDSLVTDGIEADLIERIFRVLTDIDSEGRAIRRPCSFRELMAIVDPDGALERSVQRILETFAKDGASFIVGIPGAFERPDVLVDIGHEAFIRCWRRISDPVEGWLIREFQDGLTWRALLVQARDFQKNADSTLSATTTEERERWLARVSPRWTERHGGGWDIVEALMMASRDAREEMQAATARAAATEAQVLIGESLAVNRLARDHLAAGRAEAALVLASSALPYDGSRPLVPEAVGTLVLALQQHLGIVTIRPEGEGPACFSPDQSLLATASWTRVQVWSVESGLELFQWNTGAPIESIEFAASGATLIVRLYNTIQFWRVFEERLIDEIVGKEPLVKTVLSPDGSRLLVCENASITSLTVSLWDTATGRCVYSSLGSDNAIRAVAFHTDGRQLALVAGGYRLVRIDCVSGSVLSDRTLLDVAITTRGYADPVSCIAFSPDGERLAMADHSGMVTLWETASGRSIDAVRMGDNDALTHQYSRDIVVAPRGNRLLVRGLSDAWIWPTASDISDDMRKLEGQFHEYRFSPDGMRILARAENRTRLCDAGTGSYRDLEGNSAEFSPDGQYLLTIDGPLIRIYDAERDQFSATLESAGSPIASAAFSPDSKRIVATSANGVVRVWELVTQRELASLRVQDVEMRSARYSGDGRVILVHGSDRALRLWTGVETAIHLDTRWGRHYVFSPDGNLLLADIGQTSDSVWTDTFLLMDIPAGSIRARVPGNKSEGRSKAVFSRDGKRLLVHAADQAMVWDVAASARLGSRYIGLHARSPGYLSADGALVLSLNAEERRIELWDASTGELLQAVGMPSVDKYFQSKEAPGVMTVREIVRDDGSGSDHTTVFESLWDVLSRNPALMEQIEHLIPVSAASACGRFVVVQSPDRRHPLVARRSGLPVASLDAAGDATFSPDGSLLALFQQTIRIIESETGEERAVLSGHTTSVATVDFSDDGKRIVSADHNGTARVWRTDGTCEIVLEIPDHRIFSAKFADAGTLIRLVMEKDYSVYLRSIWIGSDVETLIQTARGYLPIDLSGERPLEAPLSSMQVGVRMRFD